MICAFPQVMNNPLTGKKMLVPCGKCIQCRVNRRIVWEFRLKNEYKKWHYVGSFVTATYSDDKYDCSLGLNYGHIQRYFKRLRKAGYKFKAFTVGEYGKEEARCHWHILLFGIPYTCRKDLFERWNYCYFPRFTVTPITGSRIRYCLKYLDKQNYSKASWFNEVDKNPLFFYYDYDAKKLMYSDHGVQYPRSWCSQGLGKDYFLENFQKLYYVGSFDFGCKSYKPSKYQIECISRNDIKFGINRSKWFDRNFKIQSEISRVGLKQFQINNQIQALNKEYQAIKEAHQYGDIADQDHFFKDHNKGLTALDLLEEEKIKYDNEKYYMRALKRLSDASEGDTADFFLLFDDLCQIYQGFDSWLYRLVNDDKIYCSFFGKVV